jgi:DNA-binding transcriptional ArsR family regulator
MKGSLSPAQLARVAERFKALGEPARLRMLDVLRHGEMAVSELITATGLGQANVSKHLQLLHAAGLVARRKEGLFVYYSLADRDVLLLCDIMCDRIHRQGDADQRRFGTGA